MPAFDTAPISDCSVVNRILVSVVALLAQPKYTSARLSGHHIRCQFTIFLRMPLLRNFRIELSKTVAFAYFPEATKRTESSD